MNKRIMPLEQVAFLCGVSLERVRNWIGKGKLHIAAGSGEEKVYVSDMIDFLVKHNMPIPDPIMPLNMRKVLFVYSDDFASKKFLGFLIDFYRQVKKNNLHFIADHTMYGPEAKMKVMVFNPHLVILDMTENDRDAALMARGIKELEEFSSIRLLAVVDPELFEGKRASATKCGIDEVLPHSADIGQLARRLLDLA
jgi:hypothetical protein